MNGGHLSGAERIVCGDFTQIIPDLMLQAMSYSNMPDSIAISVDTVDTSSIIYKSPLGIRTVESSSPEDALRISADLLKNSGVSPAAVEKANYLLRTGPSAGGGNMRGAVIMDSASGDRLEPDSSRGVRVSRVDYTMDARDSLINKLREEGIFHRRVVDALAIATKAAGRRETVAELCRSDDPDYTTGYIASRKCGYVRITNIKKKGDHVGGRVLFVRRNDLNIEEYIHYLERQPVIIRVRARRVRRVGSVKIKDLTP